MSIRRLCVFCGSSVGDRESQQVALELGTRLAQENIELVFGGGRIGLMGILADALLAHNGSATGVIPEFLIGWEVAHTSLTQLIVVDSMHDRKATMASLSDAFVALPGGFGTFEEFFEALTWLQLGLHAKPCILLNTHGFFTPLLDFINSALAKGFIDEKSLRLITVCSSIDELIHILHSQGPTPTIFQEGLT